MTAFKRTLVALDRSEMDRRLLAYTAALRGPLAIEKIYFVHIIRDLNMPRNAEVQFLKLFAPEHPIDEQVRKKLNLDVEAALGENGSSTTQIEVIEGKPYEKLIHWTQVKEIDLLIVGRKIQSKGSGITARRVARKAGCNVLFVPENAAGKIRRIIVPIDFSENAARALRTALKLKTQLQAPTVQALYIVDMPPGDYYMEPRESSGFRMILLDSARSAYRDFLQKYHLDGNALESVFLENNFVNVAAHINQYAREQEADLIVIGAQGHTALENFLYGSVTESLVERSRETPILIVR